MKVCKACNGTGWEIDDVCSVCSGEGVVGLTAFDDKTVKSKMPSDLGHKKGDKRNKRRKV